jgi:hypothetical protein
MHPERTDVDEQMPTPKLGCDINNIQLIQTGDRPALSEREPAEADRARRELGGGGQARLNRAFCNEAHGAPPRLGRLEAGRRLLA